MANDPSLAFEGPNAPAPWIAWGPYLWDPTWTQNMFKRDGAHPCDSGSDAVSQLWYNHLSTESTANVWFLKDGGAQTAVAKINSPANNAVLPPGAVMNYAGEAFDPQTPVVPTNSFVWSLIRANDGRAKVISTGVYSAAWNGRGDGDAALASGVYYIRIRVGAFTALRKLTLLK